MRRHGLLPAGRLVVVSQTNSLSSSAVFQLSTSWGSIQRKENRGAVSELFTNKTAFYMVSLKDFLSL